MTRAVFLDRDGVLNEERNYLSRVEDVVIIPGAPAALKRLADAGFKLFVVSNQSGVGRGYFTIADVEKFHNARRFSTNATNETMACNGYSRMLIVQGHDAFPPLSCAKKPNHILRDSTPF